MSRVFLAEDTALEREVVVKVLSPQLDDESYLQRFRNEALQTARLQHPTIVSIFEFGIVPDETDRQLPFYIMPYVRGESLRSRLRHEETLSVNITLRILRNVLDALIYAHAHGVVHRDIKPENVFLSGTSAVLADFGVAKALAGPRRDSGLTSPGTSVGTPAYMAPEQFAGEDSTDGRADLYSVGVVAYEMLTGRLPWDANTSSELIAAKARNKITPLRTVRAGVPAALMTVIERCLAWEPGDRLQTAEEMLRVIESVSHSTATPAGGEPLAPVRSRWHSTPLRIAVGLAATVVLALGWQALNRDASRASAIRLAVFTPEMNSGANADTTLGHQLYHHLVASLYPVPGLQLVAETEISRMSELGVKSAQIEQKLLREGYDSALVMETQAATDGGFTMQLSLKHLKNASHENVGEPILLRSLDRLSPDSARVLVDLLTERVVARFHLTSAVRKVRETAITDAGIARSKGRDASALRTPAGLREAIALYRHAIRLDSNYAQAHADLADALALSLFYRYRTDASPYEMMATALRLSARTIALQPKLAEGFTARGYIGMVSGAPPAFVRESYATARQLNPENPSSRLWYVGLLALENSYAQALDTLADLLRLDPQSPSKRISIALYSLPPRHYEDVVNNAAQVRAAYPNLPLAAALQTWGLVLLGGSRMNECTAVPAGPYLGARAACLEKTQGKPATQAVLDTLFRLLTNRLPADSTFDASLYASEMSMYSALHHEWDAARMWMKRAFEESPLGIEQRFLRSGLFNAELISLGDSLRAEAWKRVHQEAAGPAITTRARPVATAR